MYHRLYKRFVLIETPEEINRIFRRRKLLPIQGSKSFVERIKERYFTLKDFVEIPETKSLAPDVDKIKSHVCRAYNIKYDDLHVTRRGGFSEPGNVAIYLMRHLRKDTLKQVGEQFGIEKYSTVSSIVGRVRPMMKGDRGLN